jgi:hypothetical protein
MTRVSRREAGVSHQIRLIRPSCGVQENGSTDGQ